VSEQATQGQGGATPPAPANASGATPAAAGPGQGATPPAGSDEGSLGDAGKAALEKIRAQLREAEGRARTAEKERDELRDAGKSEAERTSLRADRAEARVAELEASVKEHEREVARRRIAAEVGLNPDLIEFIQGDDERAMKASARKLSELARPADGQVGVGQGGGAGGSRPFDMNRVLRQAAGRG
jgi:Domain of unknown function (DUF4355)